MKQLDEMAEKLVPQILHKIYNTINMYNRIYPILNKLKNNNFIKSSSTSTTLTPNILYKKPTFKLRLCREIINL